MHNFAVESAKRRGGYKGGFFEFTDEDVHSIPNGITNINMAFSLITYILFVIAIVEVWF